MRLLCFIDSLGSGGAQRQLTALAVGLKQRGHAVRFLVYQPHDHFLPVLRSAGIPCQLIRPCSRWRRAWEVRRVLRKGWQDVVLAFLEAPCLYAELAKIPTPSWGLIAGERSADPRMLDGARWWLRRLHRFADCVVSNSHTNRLMLQRSFPELKEKVVTIYNMVDFKQFCPAGPTPPGIDPAGHTPFRIVVAASRAPMKNADGLARALLLLRANNWHRPVVVDWFGARHPAEMESQARTERFVEENGLADTLRFHEPTRSIESEIHRADAVGLFSYFEGLPNVVCEAMACGKPILLSDVCDAGNLVEDGKNGFLCDPSRGESIATAIIRIATWEESRRREMGLASRRMAEQLFAASTVLERYDICLGAVARQERIPPGSTHPARIPESAARFVEAWAAAGRRKYGR